MKNKKEFFGVLFSVLISVFLVGLIAYATTTIGNDVDIGDDLKITGNGLTFGNGASLSNSDADTLVLTELLFDLNGSLDVSNDLIVGTGPLQVAHTASVAYSRFGTSTTGYSSVVSASSDLLISDALEVDGIAYFDASASFAGDVRLSGSATGNYIAWDSSANILEGIGAATLKIGESGGIDSASAATMIYGYYKGVTTAITGTGVGVRGDARQQSIDSSGTLQGAVFKAGNGSCSSCANGGDLGTMTGVYAEVTSTDAGSVAKTVTNARALELNLDLDQADTDITNAYGIYMKWNAGSTGGTITNGYGLWIDNEAVGGTGQMLDAAVFIGDTSMSGGVKGWDYGIDMSGMASNFGTADIRLSSSITFSTGTASPSADCTAGSLYFRAASTASASLYICLTTNEWDVITGIDIGDP